MEVLIVGLVGVRVSTMMSHRRKIPEQIGRMLSEADLLAVDGEDRVVAHRKEGHRTDHLSHLVRDFLSRFGIRFAVESDPPWINN